MTSRATYSLQDAWNNDENADTELINNEDASGDASDSDSSHHSSNCIWSTVVLFTCIAQATKISIIRWVRKEWFHGGDDLRQRADDNARADELLVSYQRRDEDGSVAVIRPEEGDVFFAPAPTSASGQSRAPSPPVPVPANSSSSSCSSSNLEPPPSYFDIVTDLLPEYYETVSGAKPPAYTRFVIQLSTESWSSQLDEQVTAL